MRISVIGLRGFPMIEGGVEKHCEALYSRLDDRIQVIVYRRKPYVKSNRKYKNITFIDFPSTKIKGFEAFFHSFIASIDAAIKKPDLVHYHNIGPALFSPIVKLRGIPVILTYHSPNYEHQKWGRLAKRLLLFSEKVALKYADRIIFVNKFQMEKYDTKIQQKSIYMPNGINDFTHVVGQSYLNKIGVDKSKYILSVGRITPEKGFDTLIKAYTKSNLRDVKLVIAGGVEFETQYMSELKRLCKNENIIFTGYTLEKDLYELYTHATLFILSSRNEGFPLVLLEAMKFNLDVLVSDIPATHLVELETEDYFKVDDWQSLSQKIKEKIDNPKSRKYKLDEYDWNAIAKKTSDLYFQILEEKR